MTSKTTSTATVAQDKASIQGMLQRIMDKLEVIEAATVASAPAKQGKTNAEAVLMTMLDRLTLKRHAILTATLAGVSYQELAKLMACDVTTVKLGLKAAITTLDIPSRDMLMSAHAHMLDQITDKEYLLRYGVSKRWWMEQKDELMSVLRASKATSNQHTNKGAK